MGYNWTGFLASVCWLIFSTQTGLFIKHTQRPIPYQSFQVNSTSKIVTRDLTLNYDYLDDSEETVGIVSLMVISILLPLLVIAAIYLPNIMNKHRGDSDDIETQSISPYALSAPLTNFSTGDKSEALDAVVAFLFSVGTTEFLTSIAKLYVGRLRPNFYDMCSWSDEELACTTTDTSRLNESRMSFPSGHSSMSFNACVFISFFLTWNVTRHLNMSDKVSPFVSDCIGLFLFFAPLTLSGWVAVSRVHDNWHHPSDVIFGALIGSVCASFCFFYLYWNKLEHPQHR